ncbi:DUF4249 domain-containing protein [Leeuwenhoekiella nanhaiensis]|uniref:DUF4249 domain-containing protein n=1 Tax=Leeuwenhoekiella nanhaiensis TaxID=1655491 RepID=A0A2G1VSF0_9FLAO|nr:DUF4249 domain-containing protein [Leeuwenhoekiella nanhaiensis]PHQ29703.1 hypothetical protein CJ305_06925 [Leeuwenhoekiella nanhaiensis]
MRLKNLKYLLCAFVLFSLGCIEEIPLEADTSQGILVVEALISNKLIRQKVKLTRSFTLEQSIPEFEENANVKVVGDDGSSFIFSEVSEGNYLSNSPFAAQPGVKYMLDITTQDGQNYRSEEEQIIGTSEIDNVDAKRTQNRDGETGVLITVDGQSSAENGFYLYQYTETYKIISPNQVNEDLTYTKIDNSTYVFELVPKQKEEKICYNTNIGNSILVASTEGLQDKRVRDFELRFLSQENPNIAHRYSINVSQYVVSNATFRFYSTLKELSQSSNVFVQNQPGFLEGNLYEVGNRDNKVIGFFSVVSLAEKRIFFDYEDFFPSEEDEKIKGSFAGNCDPTRPLSDELGRLLERGSVKFLEDMIIPEPDHPEGGGVYRVVPTRCMDCTVHGTNIKPDFWIE